MIINKLKLENFGLFPGKQEINLLPENGRKIVLIGGKNGNGKTTIFDAIRLCLYGPMVLERRSTKPAYMKYLLEKIHHDPSKSKQATTASVGLEFQHAHLGTVDTFNILRKWENTGSGCEEVFRVKKNGKDLSEIESDQWQDFINDLIPPGLSQLFFFDGEKIQALAEDATDNKQLSDSFKALLGVDLVEKLKSDLEIYTVKQLKQNGAKDLQKHITTIQKEEKIYETKLDVIFQEKAQLQSKIDKVRADIERQEFLIKKEGGLFAEKREKLKDNQKKSELELNLVENQLRDLCADILPFVFAQKLSKRLKKTLLDEEAARNERITQKNIQTKITKLKQEMAKKGFWSGTNIKDKDTKNISKDLLQKISGIMISEVEKKKLVHNLSSEDHNQIIGLIDRAMNETPDLLNTLTKKHNALSKKRHKIGKELSFAPSDSVISKEVKKCNVLHQQLGTLEQTMKTKDEDLKKLQFAHEKISRDLKRLLEELKNKDHLSNRLKLVTKVQTALEDYHKKLEDSKIKEFSKLFIESYNQIARKKNVFEKINVNTKDYSVTLYKKGNKKTPKAQLSAGEKQIYAIAVLWTLTKISRRPLPFIIDTPLGRLDIDHRDNLIQNFFPEASHQLIVLSTDTEVDKKYMTQLKPRIIRTYNLNYQEGKSQVEKGYFWN